MSNFDNYECDGQIDIFEFLPKSVDARGFMDDPYCPGCDIRLDDVIDAPKCPECGTLLDWDRWHYINRE